MCSIIMRNDDDDRSIDEAKLLLGRMDAVSRSNQSRRLHPEIVLGESNNETTYITTSHSEICFWFQGPAGPDLWYWARYMHTTFPYKEE